MRSLWILWAAIIFCCGSEEVEAVNVTTIKPILRDKRESEPLFIGSGSDGSGSTAVALAVLLLKERLNHTMNIQPYFKPPKACYQYPADHPGCFEALLFRLEQPRLNGKLIMELGVAVSAETILSGWHLQKRGLNYLGDLAPPVRRMCMVTDTPAAARTYTDLARTDVAANYALNDSENNILKEFLYNKFGIYYWQGKETINGTYIPEWCIGTSKCATLMTGDPSEANVAFELVRRWRWHARVVSVGPHLPRAVLALHQRPLLLCAWAPYHGSLAHSLPQETTPLAVPPCEPDDDFCPFEPRRLAKLVHTPAFLQHKRELQLLAQIKFTLKQFRELSILADELKDEAAAARKWLSRHEDVAKMWITPKIQELRVKVAVPVSGSLIEDPKTALGLLAAAMLAEIDAAQLISGYNFKVETFDSACSVRKADKFFSDAKDSGEYESLVALAGPACGAPLRAVAAHTHAFKLPLLAYTAASPLAEEDGARWLVLAGGDVRDLASALAALMLKLRWGRIAVLTESGARGFVDPSRLRALTLHHVELPETYDVRDYDTIYQWAVESSRRGARILAVGAEQPKVARAALCAGLAAGLLPRHGTVWLLPATLPNAWIRPHNDTHNCTEQQLLSMAEGHLSVGGSWIEAVGKPDAAEWRRNWTMACKGLGGCGEPPHHAALLYDSLVLIFRSIAHLLTDTPLAITDLHNRVNARSLIEHMMHSNYTGITGDFNFRTDQSRIVPVNIYQWINGTRTVVGRWDSATEGDGTLTLEEDLLTWATENGLQPDDGEEKCALQWLATLLSADCHTAFVALGALLLAILAAALAGVFVVCKRRVEREYKRRLQDANFGAMATLRRKAQGLDRWELARERVVINRKLGTGAFGAVYGGHALLHEERGWTAVAVKTLKPGASTEEKLDFLSEAETMKRFDHKNVVRLLAVVTATEPVCSVMELLLYGDLKSFLLARRHLALGAEGAGATAEVSPRRLTSWALDAARGLSYLAQLRYVHRDVAARNCLLSAQRVLKLADFGMTRLVFENDYYRFSRKGMLPVRWMAPESLCLGVFSAASDVWSFGVLLYEIVTFGALPFQGLSNAEVLTQVKEGKTVPLPPGLKPQLEGLIKSCWHQERRTRPPAAEVAAFLADNPRLLAPCLDLPLDALPFDGDHNEARWRGFRSRQDTAGSGARSTATDTTYLSTDANEQRSPPSIAAESVPRTVFAAESDCTGTDFAHDSVDTDAFLPKYL